MFRLASSTPETATPLRLTLRRAGAGIALSGAVALWLWALPVLLTRDGFALRGGAACTQASYRDPVTGRDQPAPSTRIARQEPCRLATSGARP